MGLKKDKASVQGTMSRRRRFSTKNKTFFMFFYLGNCWVNSPQSLINKGVQRLRASFDSRQGHQVTSPERVAFLLGDLAV